LIDYWPLLTYLCISLNAILMNHYC